MNRAARVTSHARGRVRMSSCASSYLRTDLLSAWVAESIAPRPTLSRFQLRSLVIQYGAIARPPWSGRTASEGNPETDEDDVDSIVPELDIREAGLVLRACLKRYVA